MGKSCTGLRIRQGSGVRGGRPCCLQARIVAALLAFRLTLALFLSSLLLPCLFADFGLPLAFPCKVGFHLIGFRKMLYTLSDAISRRLDSFLRGAYAFFLSAISCVSFSFRFFRDFSDGSFPSFLLGNISRILHRHLIPWNALHGIFS